MTTSEYPYATRPECIIVGGQEERVDANNSHEEGLVVARPYGVQTPNLVARNGNGALYGETTVQVEQVADNHLLEIQAMRSAIMECTQPGDEILLAYLAVDEQLVRDKHIKPALLVQEYPDIEAYIFSALTSDEKLREMIADIIPPDHFPKTVEASLGVLAELSQSEGERVLRILVGHTMEQQMNGAYPEELQTAA